MTKTLIVWNNKTLVVKHVNDGAAESMCDEIRLRLHKGEDDPRWQIADGRLAFEIEEFT